MMTDEQKAAFGQIRGFARPLRLRVIPDSEGFPIIPGRLGQIEWTGPSGKTLAVWTDHTAMFRKLWAIPGVQKHQTGDLEMRAFFPPGALERVAGVIRARKRRAPMPSEVARKRSGLATVRALSRF